MSAHYEKFKRKAFSVFGDLAKECPEFEDARMLVAGSEATAALVKNDVYKTIDTDWIDAIEAALPSLDAIVRNPSIAIEDVDEILPVELSRHITEKSIKHLAQHTNLILDVQGDEVIPQKILNTYRDETFLTYENKFVNTLLLRLYTFVDKRYKVLAHSSGKEQNYRFSYSTDFAHRDADDGQSTAKVSLRIELISPSRAQTGKATPDAYDSAVARISRINAALMSYRASVFAEKLGKNYIRPPVIRTNAILKNKNLKECLTLWEFIESFDRVGYTMRSDAEIQMPTDAFITDLYSSVAFQYVDFYNGVTLSDDNRLLSTKHLLENRPEFATDIAEEDLVDYTVYDSEYRKSVPVSRLLNNRRNLSEDEKRIADAITVALKADEMITTERARQQAQLQKEKEQKQLAEKKQRIAEEKARAAEEKRQRALEKKRIAEEKRLQKELLRLELEARMAEEKRKALEEKRAKLLEKAKAKKGKAPSKPRKDTYQAKNTVKTVRSPKKKLPEFTFDGEPTIENVPVLPYTRERYSALPRKKKKRAVAEAKAAKSNGEAT